MKANFFLIMLMVCSLITHAQLNKSRTTEEEYNYMSRGYKMQVESGLDIKKGYSLMKPIEITIGNYSFTYIGLIRGIQTNSPFIGWIVKANSKVWGNNYWYSLPQDNEELLMRSFEQISTLDKQMTTAFFISYAKLNLMTFVEF